MHIQDDGASGSSRKGYEYVSPDVEEGSNSKGSVSG